MIRKPALGLEVLESRECPATVNITNGTLTVTGTAASETITLGHTTTTITVDGVPFPKAGITRVVVTAGAGNDLIRDGSGLGAFLYGGLGNDTINGNGGADRIYGGAGNDILNGGDGDDILWGGGGTDTMNGGAGLNTVKEGSPVRTRPSTAMEAEIIQLVNIERGKVGLPPLAFNNALSYAADLHSQDMAALSTVLGANQAMQHTLYGTARPEIPNRLDLAGYDTWTNSFAYGENIAYGYASAASVMNAWMNSAGHRANILSANFAEIGVSVRADANGVLFFTQVFGKQT
ncbi:MAG: CAP domain-containing protein [Gemmataceae bacterium]